MPPTPLPNDYNPTHPLKSIPNNACMYTTCSFTQPTKREKEIEKECVYNPNNNLRIAYKLLGYQNVIRIEHNALLIVVKSIQSTQLHTSSSWVSLTYHIFILYNYFRQPCSTSLSPIHTTNSNQIHQIRWNMQN